MRFQELDPNDVWKMLEAKDENGNPIHQDVLTPLQEKEAVFFRHSTCPRCQKYGSEPFVNPRAPFSPGNPLPNKLLRCLSCGTEFDPYTRLITKVTTGPA